MKIKMSCLVLIDLYTGLRIGELCALSWPDFSPDRDYFDISFILERLSKKWVKDHSEYTQVPIIGAKPDASTALYLGPPKTESGKRRIHMSEQAISAFYDIELQQKEWGLYKPDGFVFLQLQRKSVRTGWLSKTLQRRFAAGRCDLSKIPYTAPHICYQSILSYNSIFQPWLKF